MSLDVYLIGKEVTEDCTCDSCGHHHTRTYKPTLYDANITHNLSKMADEAGIGDAMWCPEKIGITTASELIPILRTGLQRLKDDPKHFRQFNASNGWGLYEHFVPFVEQYLNACREYPDAEVQVSR